MNVSSQTITEYFERYEWKYAVTEDPNTFLSGFVDSKQQNYGVVVSVKDKYVTLTTPYKQLPDDKNLSYLYLQKLMSLNYEWPLVKLSLDKEDKTLMISLEFWEESFDYKQFQLGLDLLTEATELLLSELPSVTCE